jgi:hypothetical protein
MRRKIGGPDTWRDFSAVSIRRDDYAGNSIRIAANDRQRQFQVDRPTRRSVLLADDTTDGECVLRAVTERGHVSGRHSSTAGVRLTIDDAVNFWGGGFDDRPRNHARFRRQRSRFDASGNLMNWWMPRDEDAFRERAACVASQYSGYPSLPNAS